jgi:hypothetical protein
MLKIPELDNLILLQLNDDDILNYKHINKSCQNFCNTDSFWEKRTLNKYPKFKEIEKSENRTWKITYVLLGYYTINFNPNIAIKKISMGGIEFLDLIKYFILNGADNLKPALSIAKQRKDRDLIEFFLQND